LREGLDDLFRIVARAVVDDDDLIGGLVKGLPAQTGQRATEQIGAIVGA
jgi:hypothetical protein